MLVYRQVVFEERGRNGPQIQPLRLCVNYASIVTGAVKLL